MDFIVSVLRQRGPRQEDRYLAARAAGKLVGMSIAAEGNRLGRMCFGSRASGDDNDSDHQTTRRRTGGTVIAPPEPERDNTGNPGRSIGRRREMRPDLAGVTWCLPSGPSSQTADMAS